MTRPKAFRSRAVRRTPAREVWAGPVWAALVWLLAAAPALAQGSPLEAAVKATYLYKFTPFVAWPVTVHEAPSSPFGLCVVGSDAFGDLLDKAVAGQQLDGRSFAVRRLRTMDLSARCHVLYLALAGGSAIAGVLDAVRGTPVLTVTDQQEDPAAKGIVNFVLVDGRVRFEIDNQAAAENGIALSSKLLSLAVSVRGRV